MTRARHAITEAERARIEHVDRLVVLGPSGVRELIDLLADPSWTVRRAVVAALASLGDDAVGPLCAWLRDARTTENAIAAAVDALSASLGKTATQRVLALTDAARPAVVADAAQVLGRRRASSAVATLARLAEHSDDNVAVSAIEALGAIGGTEAVDVLIRVIESRRFFRTFPAMQVLARTGDPRAVPPLAALLSDDAYRFEAIRALGRTGSEQAIAPIAGQLSSPSDAIVRIVAIALADLLERATWAGTADAVAAALRSALAPWLPRFTSAMRGADPGERAAIATLLGHAGDATILPAITALLEDAAAAPAATEALQQLGRSSEAALIAALAGADPAQRAAILPLIQSADASRTIRGLLRDHDAEVRARACEALARVRDVGAVPLLFDALGDPSPRVTHAAVAAIQALGSAETERLALAAARSNRPGVRRHAIRIIGAFGFPSAFELLREAIDDSDRRIAELAIAALAGLEDTRVEPLLEQLATSRDDAVRSAVMRSAGQRGGAIALKLLTRGLSDMAAWVRYYAVQGLGRAGMHDASTVPAPQLIDRLHDPAPQVRVAAIEALSQLGSPAAWQAVVEAARSTDPDERRAGLVGVGMQRRPGAAAILAEAARAGDAATRLVAIAGLATLDDPDALAALAAAIDDPAPDVRDAAVSLLASRDDEGAAQLVVDATLRADDQAPVHRALSRPGRARVAAISARLTTADSRSAGVLVAALARMHDDPAIAALFSALSLATPAARAAAATALVSMRVEGATDAVLALAGRDPDPEVRRVCTAALGTARG